MQRYIKFSIKILFSIISYFILKYLNDTVYDIAVIIVACCIHLLFFLRPNWTMKLPGIMKLSGKFYTWSEGDSNNKYQIFVKIFFIVFLGFVIFFSEKYFPNHNYMNFFLNISAAFAINFFNTMLTIIWKCYTLLKAEWKNPINLSKRLHENHSWGTLVHVCYEPHYLDIPDKFNPGQLVRIYSQT
jgi:hypothetical protein